jgi:hypothetical protein
VFIPFLLLGLICTSLIFLIQRASRRQLARLQEQLSSLEKRNKELFVALSEQSEETQRLLSHLEQELEEARPPSCPDEKDKQLTELHASHLQLKKQFEEKSIILHQTRKELFIAQGEHFSLQREKEEQEYTLSSEIQMHIQQSEEESHPLEKEVLLLEQLISSLLSQKTKTTKRKKASEEDFFCLTSSHSPTD